MNYDLLDRIKIILKIGTEDKTKDDLLMILLENAVNTVCVYLNVNDIPDNLSFVAEELAVARYRKIGSEGISTEKVEELSTTFSVDDLNRYKGILNMYKDNNSLGGKKLRTL